MRCAVVVEVFRIVGIACDSCATRVALVPPLKAFLRLAPLRMSGDFGPGEMLLTDRPSHQQGRIRLGRACGQVSAVEYVRTSSPETLGDSGAAG